MTIASTDRPTDKKPLRLWPGVVAAALLLLARFGVPLVAPEALIFGVAGGLVGALAITVWWAFFSRGPRFERWIAVPLMVIAVFVTKPILHESVATAGMGMLFYIYAIPVLSLALVVWAVASRRLSAWPRRVTMVATLFLACGGWALARTGGITANGKADLAWRWAKTPEERLLAQVGAEKATVSSAEAAALGEAEWPGFRGPARDGVVRGVRIATDWSASPPVEVWRREVGPG